MHPVSEAGALVVQTSLNGKASHDDANDLGSDGRCFTVALRLRRRRRRRPQGKITGKLKGALDTLVLGDTLWWIDGQVCRIETSCAGNQCVMTFLGEQDVVATSDFDPRDEETVQFVNETRCNGVTVVRLRDTDDPGHGGYTAWANYVLAIAGVSRGTGEDFGFDLFIPASLGNGSGSSLVGGSTVWTGAMVGVDVEASQPGQGVLGDAALEVDFPTATLDLTFSNIAGTENGARHAVIAWQNVPMSGGAFEATGLDGRFYGPNHEETGGVFERNGIAGAFSLGRQ